MVVVKTAAKKIGENELVSQVGRAILTSCSSPTFDRAFLALPLQSVAVKRGSTAR